MKNLFATLCLALFVVGVMNAQIKTPAPSPAATITQVVGLTDVEVVYSRPSVKGRTIFGADALVPNGKIWRTGANSVTQISFSNDVSIEGQELKAGKYGILTIPNSSEWAVHFYAFESGSWSSYVEKTPELAVKIKPMKTSMSTESFTISIDDVMSDGATIHIKWANTAVPIKVSTNTDKTVMSTIDKVMNGPSTGDYYNAASYYLDAGKDPKQALAWMEKATSGENKRYWQIKKLAELYALTGNTSKAIETAKMSLELATKAGNNDYIKLNKDNIAKWSM